MRNPFAPPLRVELSRRSVALYAGGALKARAEVAVAGDAQSLGTALETVLDAAGKRASGVTLVLSAGLVRTFLATPPSAARYLADLEGGARLRFQQLYGEAPDGWRLRADWRIDRPFLVCAAPRSLLDTVARVLAHRDLPALAIRPAFSAHWESCRRKPTGTAWLAVLDPDCMTLALIRHGRLAALRAHWLPAEHAPLGAWIAAEAAREALRAGETPPEAVHVAGQASADTLDADQTPGLVPLRTDSGHAMPRSPFRLGWHADPRGGADFAAPSVTRLLRAVTPVTLMLACLTLGLAANTATRTARLLERNGNAARALELAALASRQTGGERGKPPVIAAAQVTAVNRAIAQLNLPWRDVFDAVEAASGDDVALLALEPDALHRVIRGEAEVKDGAAMIAYVEQLKKQPILSRVVLTSHQINEQDAAKPLRFRFEAYWRAENAWR